MALGKTASGWLVDIQPGGRGAKRYRKTLPTKAEALAYEAWLTTKVAQSPEWQPAKRDGRRLLDGGIVAQAPRHESSRQDRYLSERARTAKIAIITNK